jgi:hypothetical protein
VGDQHGVVKSGVADSVAVGFGDAGDEAVGTEPAQVVADLAGADLVGVFAEQSAEVAVKESVADQPEHQRRLEQRVGAAIAQAQSGDAVPVAGDDWVVHGGEGLLGADRVVAESLNA